MSASLVGSEMCIRDRSSVVQFALQAARRLGLARLRPRYRREKPGCTSSVSYTHLTLPTICSV
eukprot:978527-Alexandrium_andersonii.AAC.1